VVINQKGIDPPSLDLLARAGVIYSYQNFRLSVHMLCGCVVLLLFYASNTSRVWKSSACLCTKRPFILLATDFIYEFAFNYLLYWFLLSCQMTWPRLFMFRSASPSHHLFSEYKLLLSNKLLFFAA
jgi:hypothetical protein